MLNRDKDIERHIRTLFFWVLFVVFAFAFSQNAGTTAAGKHSNILHNSLTGTSFNHREAVPVTNPCLSSLQRFLVDAINRNFPPVNYRNFKITNDCRKTILAIVSLEAVRNSIARIPLTDLLCCPRLCSPGDPPVLS